ncbi:2'-5' RNA ligase family protein [Phenylobacterium sp.]|uniref:2'-5' RNA ligase family protein n=1 Tax=Phenylobacterium sp. TaxID=1871053 RepID=UPI00272F1E52|nr:2'-5' RNA ligase family protein [Phenylobacterium sp.]MDP1873749.1 2'-5' RNA ligase family protein [Phenylobacterium sp.]
MTDPAPLIITAALDQGGFDWFDDLRRAHFPSRRNVVPAHLTLFHALPGEQEPFVAQTLKAACAARAPMRLEVRGPWFIGRGVAYRIASPDLEALRAELAAAFAPWLTSQDRAPFRPHITIQNKAEPDEARTLCERLQLEFEPFDITAEGLLVWRYLGGPWEAVARVGFGGEG